MMKTNLLKLFIVGLMGFAGSVEARKTGAEKAAKELAKRASQQATTDMEAYELVAEPTGALEGSLEGAGSVSQVTKWAACMYYLKNSWAGRKCQVVAAAAQGFAARHPALTFNSVRITAALVAAAAYWSIKFMPAGAGAAIAVRIAAGTTLGEVAKFTFADIGRAKRFIAGIGMATVCFIIDYAIVPDGSVSVSLAPVSIAFGIPLLKAGYRPLLKAFRKKLDQERSAKEGTLEEEYDAEAAIGKLQEDHLALKAQLEALAAQINKPVVEE